MRLKRPLWRSHTLLSDAKMPSFDVVFTPSTCKSLFSGPSCIVSDWTSNIGTIGTTPLGGGSSLLIRTVVLLDGWPRGDGDLTLKKLAPLIFCRNHCLFAKSFYQIISGHDGSLRYSAKTYNTRHISWDSCDISALPMLFLGSWYHRSPKFNIWREGTQLFDGIWECCKRCPNSTWRGL